MVNYLIYLNIANKIIDICAIRNIRIISHQNKVLHWEDKNINSWEKQKLN